MLEWFVETLLAILALENFNCQNSCQGSAYACKKVIWSVKYKQVQAMKKSLFKRNL